MFTIDAVFFEALDIEHDITLLSKLYHVPQMCLDEELGIVDLREEHVEGELIDNIIILWGGARVDVRLV